MSESKNIRFDVDGVTYYWEGCPGVTMHSIEKHVKVGDCRVICDSLFYCIKNDRNNHWGCQWRMFGLLRPSLEWSTNEAREAFKRRVLG